eukprot:7080417-Pyramimonas_sp.AAC.1
MTVTVTVTVTMTVTVTVTVTVTDCTSQTFVEELVRLPGGSCWCYTPPASAGPVAPLPARANG